MLARRRVKVSKYNKKSLGNSVLVQWLGLQASTAEGTGLIPGWGTKIPHATWHGQKKSPCPLAVDNPAREIRHILGGKLDNKRQDMISIH